MKTEQTEAFANACKELSTYFLNLVPDIHEYTNEDGIKDVFTPKWLDLKIPEDADSYPTPPFDLVFLLNLYSVFEEEINENIKISNSDFVTKLVVHLLENCLPYEKSLPSEEQFFKLRMFDEAELLYNFKSITRKISYRFGWMLLINDPKPF